VQKKLKKAKIQKSWQRNRLVTTHESRKQTMPLYLLAAGALIVFLYVINNRRSSKLPPSPPSLPLIGHLHLIGRLAHRSLLELQLRYGGGGGLLFLQLGRRPTLVVSTAAAAADLFKNHDLAFASRPRSVGGDKLMYGCSNVSFAPYGENWRRGKKIAVVHLLSPRRVESFAPVRVAEVAALVARTRRTAEAGEAVEMRELLYGYTNAVVTRAATGAAGATAEKLKQLMGNSAALMAGFQPEDVLPDAPARFVRWATGLDKKIEDMAEAWDKFLSDIVAAHKEKGVASGDAGEEAEDFLDVLLRLREEGADGLELTDDRIKATIEVIFAVSQKRSSSISSRNVYCQ
jgi:cytochrome P450